MSKQKLSDGFKKQMFKPTERQSKNLGHMTSKDIRAEYTKQAKVANKRIAAIHKSGMYSHSLAQLEKDGITKFGLKNQSLMTDAEIKTAYKTLMRFLGDATSSKTGIKSTIDKVVANFGLSFDGDYALFSQKSKKIFELYEDLNELAKHGELETSNKYDIVHDLGQLFDAGLINKDTKASELVDILNANVTDRKAKVNQRANMLKFNWKI